MSTEEKRGNWLEDVFVHSSITKKKWYPKKITTETISLLSDETKCNLVNKVLIPFSTESVKQTLLFDKIVKEKQNTKSKGYFVFRQLIKCARETTKEDEINYLISETFETKTPQQYQQLLDDIKIYLTQNPQTVINHNKYLFDHQDIEIFTLLLNDLFDNNVEIDFLRGKLNEYNFCLLSDTDFMNWADSFGYDSKTKLPNVTRESKNQSDSDSDEDTTKIKLTYIQKRNLYTYVLNKQKTLDFTDKKKDSKY